MRASSSELLGVLTFFNYIVHTHTHLHVLPRTSDAGEREGLDGLGYVDSDAACGRASAVTLWRNGDPVDA